MDKALGSKTIMASVKRNILANYLGQFWASALGFVVVPIYIKCLGVDAYGLIGFFLSIQALVSILDLGLSTTANREVARCTANSIIDPDLVRIITTLQSVYFFCALCIAVGVLLASGFISDKWIRSEAISESTIAAAVVISGITMGLRWPVALYTGILRGMQRQVSVNMIAVAVSTFKNVGAVVVVMFFSRSILSLLQWYLLSGLFEVVIFHSVAVHAIPGYRRSERLIHWALLKKIWVFSFTVGLISVFAAILKQTDKVLISKLLPLDQLGYYMVATQAVMAVNLFISPILVAIFPLFTSLYCNGDYDALAVAYHKYSQIVSFVGIPVATFLIFFSYDVILLWTHSELTAINSHFALSFLALAAMFNNIMQVSYLLQLASGLHWIALLNNILSLILILPLTYYLVSIYGIAGGAVAWATFNIGYYLIVPQVTHRYILRNHLQIWVLKDTMPFILFSVFSFGLAALVAAQVDGQVVKVAFALSGFIIYYFVSITFHKSIRGYSTVLATVIRNKFAGECAIVS